MTMMGMAMQYNQMMIMMQEAKYDNGTHQSWQQIVETHNGNEINGRHLERRSRGVTTLHHYERISSRDLEWHRWEMEEKEKR